MCKDNKPSLFDECSCDVDDITDMGECFCNGRIRLGLCKKQTLYGLWVKDSSAWLSFGSGEIFNTPHLGVAKEQLKKICGLDVEIKPFEY